MSKTIAIFGAGTGLGTSVARRFGAEGYSTALVARRPDPLRQLTDSLTADGIDAAPFSADLSDERSALTALERIRDRFGGVDVLYYAPMSLEVTFMAARELRAAMLERLLQLFLLTPVELVHAVLPEMVTRGDGAIVVGHGGTSLAPRANASGVGPAQAAMRNYLLSLHGELADLGVYAGMVAIRAMIARSAGHEALVSGAIKIPGDVPVIDPDEIAGRVWELTRDRTEVEAVMP